MAKSALELIKEGRTYEEIKQQLLFEAVTLVVEMENYNCTQAARRLKMHRNTLHRIMAEGGIYLKAGAATQGAARVVAAT